MEREGEDLTLRSVGDESPVLAGVEAVPVPPFTADILPDDAIFDILRLCGLPRVLKIIL
jgi:hypothetical protein